MPRTYRDLLDKYQFTISQAIVGNFRSDHIH